jgi:peptidoglycan/xylan/chitin deacetylase (PgdA/CDA1 family)
MTCLFLILFNVLNPSYSFSQTPSENKINCNCVIFRLDDIQDKYLNKSQLALMNFFLNNTKPLSLAIILNYIGNDTSIVNKIDEGYDKGLFELALHGWNHENFSKFSEHDQLILLSRANEKMYNLFGVRSTVFIPPSFDFNNSTLDVMRELGVRIISSFDQIYIQKNQSYLITQGIESNSTDNKKVFHFPSTVEYSYADSNNWNTYSNNQTLHNIDNSISKYGYAVVTLHPQAFSISQEGNLTNAVNATQLNDLKQLVDYIVSKNIKLTSFNELSKSYS